MWVTCSGHVQTASVEAPWAQQMRTVRVLVANRLVDEKGHIHIDLNISTLDHYELHWGFNFVR